MGGGYLTFWYLKTNGWLGTCRGIKWPVDRLMCVTGARPLCVYVHAQAACNAVHNYKAMGTAGTKGMHIPHPPRYPHHIPRALCRNFWAPILLFPFGSLSLLKQTLQDGQKQSEHMQQCVDCIIIPPHSLPCAHHPLMCLDRSHSHPPPPSLCVCLPPRSLMRGFNMGGAPDTARTWHGYLPKGAVLLSGFLLSRRAPLGMYLFATAKGHKWPRGISKISKWVPIVGSGCS